jgi:UDP:flavonoid glycosyltransferase YjiC (YdhE family)
MRITLLAPGSRGDVQPYVALGTGLRAAGHAVRVLAATEFEDLVRAHGLAFADMGGTLAETTRRLQGLLEQGKLWRIMADMGRAARDLAREAAAATLQACADADLMVAGLGGLFFGAAVAEKLGRPLVQALLYPLAPTRAFPSVLTALPQSPLTAWANPLTFRLAQQTLWQPFRPADARARAQVLDLPPAPFWGPFARLDSQPLPVLYGYSPAVLPRPADWPGKIAVTGYWQLPPAPGWQPPPALAEFLQAGPPPVYIGFGSMASEKPEATAALALGALEQAGVRGVLLRGFGGMAASSLPKHVLMIDSVPHGWLFPRMAAVVHHGGAGTTAASLTAGVPSIVTPFFGDQPFWARRVHALGVGPRPVARRHLTAERLAAAIREALTHPTIVQAATRLGEQIRAENGIGRAVALIEQVSG